MFKHQRSREGQLLIELQLGDKIRLHNHHAFGMDVAAQFSFALDVGKLAVARMHYAGNARRFAPRARMARKLHHGKTVDLTDDFAFGFNQDLLQQNFVAHALGEEGFAPGAHVKGADQRRLVKRILLREGFAHLT